CFVMIVLFYFLFLINCPLLTLQIYGGSKIFPVVEHGSWCSKITTRISQEKSFRTYKALEAFNSVAVYVIF
ncbi:hypothetical protein, partial [Chryseobacterium hagamense]|uniref:hypothetical protein n=1 Tax=Chryseobacterium hagamense TaxID=395935 RepID=UPI001E654229